LHHINSSGLDNQTEGVIVFCIFLMTQLVIIFMSLFNP